LERITPTASSLAQQAFQRRTVPRHEPLKVSVPRLLSACKVATFSPTLKCLEAAFGNAYPFQLEHFSLSRIQVVPPTGIFGNGLPTMELIAQVIINVGLSPRCGGYLSHRASAGIPVWSAADT
jgi:hypothetical protein